MGLVTVKYNNNTLIPTPTVSRSYQFLDYGGRFGQVEQIELNSFLTGLVGDVSNVSGLTSTFGGQFKSLEVFDNNSLSIYRWDNLILQEISIPNSSYPQKGFIPYNVRFLSYQTPSGIVDPINEYSFNQGEDGIVTVNHKISAKGVKNNNGALDNAINFVKLFVHKNPFDSCAPTFLPSNLGVLTNVSETVDRASCTYSVNEVYKYSTGIAGGYLQSESVSIDDSKLNDYPSVDLSLKLEGSPIDNNFSTIMTAALALSPELVLNSYGITTTGLFRNGFSLSEDTGSCSIEIKASFFSGSSSDYSGFFDYNITYNEDITTDIQNWGIEGDFSVKGPLSFRQSRVSAFKSANEGTDGFNTYLSGLLKSSYLSTTFTGHGLTLNNLNITENTGLGQLKLSASYSDYDTASGLVNPSYTIDAEPSKWIYELIPAANIEGDYVIQDLQMRSAANVRINVNATTTGTRGRDIGVISGVADSLSGIYLSNGFLLTQNLSSGINSCEISNEIKGEESQALGILTSKCVGSFGNKYKRRPGFSFGY